MPPIQSKPEIDRFGHFRTGESGLLVPESYRAHSDAQLFQTEQANLRGYSAGVPLDRDVDTQALKFPRKGSGYDDFAAAAVVDGYVSNVGIAPIVSSLITGLVLKQVNRAMTASVELTGRKTPVRIARDAIARFNDSPGGLTEALASITYGQCVYNRGTPIATVPITMAFDRWEENGLNPVPILSKNQKRENASRFYLTVDWTKHGPPVPYLPNILDLEPTGVFEYPYWYRARRENKSAVWVLLHHTQILPILPGKMSPFLLNRRETAGIGTSPVWACLQKLAEDILVNEEALEKMLYALTEGIYILTNVEMQAGKIREAIEEGRKDGEERGYRVTKGTTFINAKSDGGTPSLLRVNFREQTGKDPEKHRQEVEDYVALCFGEPLSSIVIRGGVGYGVQSEEAADNAAESGIGAIMFKVGLTLGAIYPRAQFAVTRPNDRTQRLNIKTLQTLTSAVVPLLDRSVLTPEQVQDIIDRDIMYIPEARKGDVNTSANADDNQEDIEETEGDGDEDATGDEQNESSEKLEVQLETLYEDPDVLIADEDVDRAFDKARRRVGSDLADLLNADSVEE